MQDVGFAFDMSIKNLHGKLSIGCLDTIPRIAMKLLVLFSFA